MNLGEMFRTWLNVLTKPGEEVFEAEKSRPQATLGTALIMMVIAAVIGALFTLLRGWMFQAQLGAMGGFEAILQQADLPPELSAQLTNSLSTIFSPRIGIAGALGGLVMSLLGFLVFVGILHLVARLLGGQGEYGRYAYLNASFYAPLSIVAGLLGFIPVLGSCLAFLLVIYEMVLAFFATKVEYKLSSGRALVVVLLPLIVAVVLVSCLTLALGGMLAALLSGTN